MPWAAELPEELLARYNGMVGAPLQEEVPLWMRALWCAKQTVEAPSVNSFVSTQKFATLVSWVFILFLSAFVESLTAQSSP